MGSDSIVNVSAPAFSKEFGKKKRTNRLAKLKQCKLDARREQWLSQAKNKGFKEELSISGGPSPSFLPSTVERNLTLGNFDTRSRGEENDGSSFHDSDLDSLANSPRSSVLGGNDPRKNNRPGSSSGSSSSGSSSSSSFCFENISGEEEDGDCVDDWEAVADALTADENQPQSVSQSLAEAQTPIGSDNHPVSSNKGCRAGILNPEIKGANSKPIASARAWRSDDAFRPQSLPNVLKPHGFSVNSGHHRNRGGGGWACEGIISQPSTCPICYEDLDVTDSCFLPCSCGFRLCLFCHKRILEADGRCPGCRKTYNPVRCEIGFSGGALPFRLARSCSINTRS